jgi:hypothetical protein
MIRLVQTCRAYPEQYDAFDEQGNQVGYLRLRHGVFTVDCPDSMGKTVYDAGPEGDGEFEDNERDYFLRFAVDAILKWMKFGLQKKPEAPDVEYEIVDSLK